MGRWPFPVHPFQKVALDVGFVLPSLDLSFTAPDPMTHASQAIAALPINPRRLIAERLTRHAQYADSTQPLRRCLAWEPACATSDLLDTLAIEGSLEKMRVLFARAEPFDAPTLARALARAAKCRNSGGWSARRLRSRRARMVQLLLEAAGAHAPLVHQLALIEQLRHGGVFGNQQLMEGVDFSQPAPDGSSWAPFLASALVLNKNRRQWRARIDQAFEAAWNALDDEQKTRLSNAPSPRSTQGQTLFHAAAAAGSLFVLRLMEPWARIDELDDEGKSALERAFELARWDAFDFLLPRSRMTPDRFGRDAAARLLRRQARSSFFGAPSPLPPEHARWVALSRAANPFLVDALGLRAIDWARQAGLGRAVLALSTAMAQRAPSAQPPIDSASLDLALLERMAYLGHESQLPPDTDDPHLTPIEQEFLSLFERLSNPNARDRFGQSALHLAAEKYLPAAIERLLERCDPLALDHQGQTPLLTLCTRRFGPNPTGALLERLLRALAIPEALGLANQAGLIPLTALIKNHPMNGALLPLMDRLRPARALTDFEGSELLQRAARAPCVFNHVWTWALEGRSVAAWAQVSPRSAWGGWPEILVSLGHIDSLSRTWNDGAFGAQGPRARMAEGKDLLFWASQSDDLTLLSHLLAMGWPARLDDLGRDLLMNCLEEGADEAALLILPQADLSLRDPLGLSALDYAQFYAHFFGRHDLERAIRARLNSAVQARQLAKASRAAPARAPSSRL
jgi:ankyrin repeat protein